MRETLKAKLSELADLRTIRLSPDEEHGDEQFLSKVENLSRSLIDLSQKVQTQKLLNCLIICIIFNKGI